MNPPARLGAPEGRPAALEPNGVPREPAPPHLGPVEKLGNMVVRPGSARLELETRGKRSVLRFSTPPAGDLLVALDDHRPRPLRSELREIGLTKLLPEDLELAPGSHHLLLCGRSESLLECSLLVFLMDSEGGVKEVPPTDAPCFLLEPGGTYWGEESVQFLAVAIDREGMAEAISYRLVHSLGEQTIPSVTGENLGVKLPVGDTMVELGCGLSKAASVRRMITVNPEPQP